MRRVEIKSEGKSEVTWEKEGKTEGMLGKQKKSIEGHRISWKSTALPGIPQNSMEGKGWEPWKVLEGHQQEGVGMFWNKVGR